MQKISPEKYIAGKARLLPLGKTYICRKAASQGTYVAIVTRQHAMGKADGRNIPHRYVLSGCERYVLSFLDGAGGYGRTDFRHGHGV